MLNSCIIAATDRSDRALIVAARAARLAAELGSRLVLAHVDEGKKKPSAVDLETLASTVGADLMRIEGQTVPKLIALAEEQNAKLIVVGLHRERRVRDLLGLTTMEKLVLRAPCPVLIAHQPATGPYAQVLAPSDFWLGSAAALEMAGRIAPSAQFHVIHALQMPLGAVFKRGSEDTEAVLARASERRAAFLAVPGLPKLAEPPEIVPGGVHQVLEFRRNELGADLVAIGAHSGRKPDHLGEYARDLMRAPPTDLLVAKPDPSA